MGSNPSLVCVISCGVRVVPDAFLHERARASGESSLMRLSSAPCKNIGVSEHTVSSGGAAMCHRITSVTRMNFRDSSRKLIRVTRIFDRFFDRISRNSTGMKRALHVFLFEVVSILRRRTDGRSIFFKRRTLGYDLC